MFLPKRSQAVIKLIASSFEGDENSIGMFGLPMIQKFRERPRSGDLIDLVNKCDIRLHQTSRLLTRYNPKALVQALCWGLYVPLYVFPKIDPTFNTTLSG